MTDPRQLKYLNAMGIPVWVSRERVVEKTGVEQSFGQQGEGVAGSKDSTDASPYSNSASDIIEELNGVTPLSKKTKNQSSNKSSPAVVTPVKDLSSLDWQALQQAVKSCQQCELHKNRTNTVFGMGHQQADWMIIGDAPASLDDQQGQPFVDQAGQLLTNMLRAIGLKRNEVYISNLLKCRPPNNREPGIQETTSCHAYLQRQIELIQPKIILVFGQVAAQKLLKTNEPLARLRGKLHQLPDTDISLVVTYHPAYLLKKTTDKRKAWEDLKLAKQQFDA